MATNAFMNSDARPQAIDKATLRRLRDGKGADAPGAPQSNICSKKNSVPLKPGQC
jgi:hypothetical protein